MLHRIGRNAMTIHAGLQFGVDDIFVTWSLAGFIWPGILMDERQTVANLQLSPELRQWMPIIIWACAIFIFSTSGFSADSTSHVITPVLRWAVPGISIAWLDLANMLIRKCAHFTEYGVLFWLLIRGPMRGRPLVAMAICVAYALTDEGHQIFVAGRTASMFDVALDSSGAMFSGFLRAAILEVI